MASRHEDETDGPTPRKRRAPATSPKSREDQLVNLAIDEIETQIREGRASAQVLTHFAKLGSSRENLEQQRLKAEVEMLRKKLDQVEQGARIEALLEEGFKAFRGYSGQPDPEDDLDDF